MDLQNLQQAVPLVDQWIDNYIEINKAGRSRVAEAGFERLNSCFSKETLDKSFYALVDQIQLPPLSQLGLGQLSSFEVGSYTGITYKDTYFVVDSEERTESLHFHEMVHIVQWDELGAQDFLLIYAAGLLQFGYRDSPLEQIAYRLQSQFERDDNLRNAEQIIRDNSRALKNAVL